MPKPKDKDKKVEKMLSPEEATMLSNIQSLVGELLNASSGGVVGEPVMETMKEEDKPDFVKPEEEKKEEEKKEEDVEKELEITPSDSSTASDDDKKRIDETQTELTEENVDEVSKALVKIFNLANPKKEVAKSELGQVVDAINKMLEVQKGQNSKVDELETAFSNMLEGLGITKQMEIAKSEESKSKPIVTNDNDRVMKAIVEVLGNAVGKKQEEPTGQLSNSQIIRKNLGNKDFLHAAIANKM